MDTPLIRCSWANPRNARYLAYHDQEWGRPCYDEIRFFEMLNLEGAQAGLSWETVLNKRDNYRRAFDGWDAEKIAAYGHDKIASLLTDPGIIRNRLKIAATINNAQAYLRLKKEEGSLAAFLWGYVEGKQIQGCSTLSNGHPVKTPLSEKISKDLVKRGFKFVGPIIIYSYMQAVGIVNDHCIECFCHNITPNQ